MTAATSKMEHFVIIVKGWKPLTIITKRSILDVVAVLDPPLRNVITFVVDNSSSSHSDNRKNSFLTLREGPTYGINGSFGSPEKSLVLILLEQTQNFV